MNWTVSALDAAPGLGIETWLLPSPAPPLAGLTWVTVRASSTCIPYRLCCHLVPARHADAFKTHWQWC